MKTDYHSHILPGIDDGFIVQADDYVDISEEYNVKKI